MPIAFYSLLEIPNRTKARVLCLISKCSKVKDVDHGNAESPVKLHKKCNCSEVGPQLERADTASIYYLCSFVPMSAPD